MTYLLCQDKQKGKIKEHKIKEKSFSVCDKQLRTEDKPSTVKKFSILFFPFEPRKYKMGVSHGRQATEIKLLTHQALGSSEEIKQ